MAIESLIGLVFVVVGFAALALYAGRHHEKGHKRKAH